MIPNCKQINISDVVAGVINLPENISIASNSEIIIPINEINHIKGDNSVYTLSSNIISINRAGTFRLSFNVTFSGTITALSGQPPAVNVYDNATLIYSARFGTIPEGCTFTVQGSTILNVSTGRKISFKYINCKNGKLAVSSAVTKFFIERL